MPAPASPNVLNLSIMKAEVKWTPAGGVLRDLGECPRVSTTPAIEKLDYIGNRSGIRSKVRSVAVEQGGTIEIDFSEMTPENLRLLLFGSEVVTNTAGEEEFDLFDAPGGEITGRFDIVGTNSVGQKETVEIYNVSITPSGSYEAISDEWNLGTITGEILLDATTGLFGKVRRTGGQE